MKTIYWSIKNNRSRVWILTIISLTSILLIAAGALDTTFDTDGMVTTAIGSESDVARALVIQPDGKIVAAGHTYVGGGHGTDFAVVRYNDNGSLDTSFDTDGIVTTRFSDGDDLAYDAILQIDGKIIVVGNTDNNTTSDTDFALARYNSDGSLDSTFDSDGILISDITGSHDYANAVALQSDGKIIVAGYTGNNEDFALARYNSDGSLDTGFDGDGIVITSIGSESDIGSDMIIQTDGKIVLAGYSSNGDDYDVALVRYNSDGSLDTSFDTDGKVTTPIGSDDDYGYALAFQSDGKLVVAGSTIVEPSIHDFALVRYNIDGSLDPSFDTNGITTTSFGSANDLAYDLAIQPGGRIIAVGVTILNSTYGFALSRYNNDGTLDTTFDGDGKTTTSFGSTERGLAVALQKDSKIIVAGSARITGSHDLFALARYDGTSTLSYSSDGIYDGWVLESTETSNTGGSMNSAATSFLLGDNVKNYQYRAILSFNTASLPDTAVIKSAQLKIKQNGAPVGTNPFNILGNLFVDIRQGPFGAIALQLADFKATASTGKVAIFNKIPTSGWYTATLNAVGLNKIHKTNLTQFKLYFATDDNNDLGSDAMKFFSGNAASATRPQLIITYYIP